LHESRRNKECCFNKSDYLCSQWSGVTVSRYFEGFWELQLKQVSHYFIKIANIKWCDLLTILTKNKNKMQNFRPEGHLNCIFHDEVTKELTEDSINQKGWSLVINTMIFFNIHKYITAYLIKAKAIYETW